MPKILNKLTDRCYIVELSEVKNEHETHHAVVILEDVPFHMSETEQFICQKCVMNKSGYSCRISTDLLFLCEAVDDMDYYRVKRMFSSISLILSRYLLKYVNSIL